MKSTFLSFLFFFSIFQSYSQTFEWVTNHPIQSASSNPAGNIQFASDANSYWVARTDSSTIVYNEIHGLNSIEQYDANDQLTGSFSIGPKAYVLDMITTAQGQLIIAGSFLDTLEIAGMDTMLNQGNSINWFVIAIDPNGTIAWKKNITTSLGIFVSLNAIAASSDGTVYFSVYDSNDSYIYKTDPAGNIVSTIAIINSTAGQFKFDPWDNIFVTGSTSTGTFSIGSYSINVPEQYMIFISRINNAGQCTWTRLAHDVTFQSPDIALDAFGSAYICGELSDSVTWGNIHMDGPQWLNDLFLVKTDSSGNFLWGKEVPTQPAVTGDFYIGKGNSISCNAAGDVLLGGNLRGIVDWGNGFVTGTQSGTENLSYILFNSAGSPLWSKNILFNGVYGRTHDVMYFNNNWFSSGTFYQGTAMFDTITVNFPSQNNTFVAKINTLSFNGMEEAEQENIVLYPNPAAESLNIPQEWIGKGVIRIYSTDGKLMKEIIPASSQINLDDLKPGMYILKREESVFRMVVN